jgi:hypothetical protein
MKRFSKNRQIEFINAPIKKGNYDLNPLTLEISVNNTNNDIIDTQFFYDAKTQTLQNSIIIDKKNNNIKIHRTKTENMDLPNLSIPLSDILNMYDIDNYDDLIQVIYKMIDKNNSKNTIYRLVNIYTRVLFNDLKKNHNTLIKIFKIIFNDYQIDEKKTNIFFKNWFNKKYGFHLNICKDFKNFLND